MSSVSTGFAEQIMPILRILCYNGSLVNGTVVSLTTVKFKPLVFYHSNIVLTLQRNISALEHVFPVEVHLQCKNNLIIIKVKTMLWKVQHLDYILFC
jgi:hypothetical protein